MRGRVDKSMGIVIAARRYRGKDSVASGGKPTQAYI
jgi:hypothetical protein